MILAKVKNCRSDEVRACLLSVIVVILFSFCILQRKELPKEMYDSAAAALKKKAVLRCFTGENGAQFVTTAGRQKTRELSALNLVLQA